MNPLFESFKSNSGQYPFGFNLEEALQKLAMQIASTGMTPEQIVRQKIQNGEMSQAQFEQLGRMASQIMARNGK